MQTKTLVTRKSKNGLKNYIFKKIKSQTMTLLHENTTVTENNNITSLTFCNSFKRCYNNNHLTNLNVIEFPLGGKNNWFVLFVSYWTGCSAAFMLRISLWQITFSTCVHNYHFFGRDNMSQTLVITISSIQLFLYLQGLLSKTRAVGHVTIGHHCYMCTWLLHREHAITQEMWAFRTALDNYLCEASKKDIR